MVTQGQASEVEHEQGVRAKRSVNIPATNPKCRDAGVRPQIGATSCWESTDGRSYRENKIRAAWKTPPLYGTRPTPSPNHHHPPCPQSGATPFLESTYGTKYRENKTCVAWKTTTPCTALDQRPHLQCCCGPGQALPIAYWRVPDYFDRTTPSGASDAKVGADSTANGATQH